MKNKTMVVVLLASVISFGCVATTPYQRAYDREMRELEWRAAKSQVRSIAWRDARTGECVLHSPEEIPPALLSYYFDECERVQKSIFRQNYYRSIWREREERWRGRRDAWRDFHKKNKR